MTRRAREMGMEHSTFMNSNGWPQAGHRMSVKDLALLAEHIIKDFPEFYPMFAETTFEFDGRAPQNVRNRNPLLRLDIGADGLKTGHTEEAGYGLVGSARQGDRRVIFVISGLDSERARAEESEAIVNWSFRHFAQKTIAKQGVPVARAEVWMGREPSVGLVPAEDWDVLLPLLGTSPLNGEVVYVGPVDAPITKGQTLAELVVKPDDLPEMTLPLVADADVPAGGFMVRVTTAANALLKKWLGPAPAI